MSLTNLYYFSYSVSHEYFHHNLLSKLCLSEGEAIKELRDMHNGDEIVFFLGDEHKVHKEFDTIEGAIKYILEIYNNFKDIRAEIKLVKYITTGERISFQTKQ